MASLLAVVALLAAGCGSNDDSGSQSGALDAPGADALDKAAGVTKITFWHGMKGANGAAVDKLVKAFNAEHSGKIEVTAVYQGDYDDTITKYKTSVQQGNMPSVVQIYDIGSRFMIDSKQTVPVQKFADKDGYTLDSIEPNIANYYSIDGQLNSMPFNTSMPLLYINKEAFTKAGLDPSKPPTTLAEIMTDAQKIKSTPGETVQYGFGATLYGWFFEQWAASANETICDNNNGRTGRVGKVNLATPANIQLLRWWQQMVSQGLAEKLDSNTDSGDNAFSSGTVAIGLESTGSLGSFTKGAAQAKSPFTVGTGFYPKINANDTGGPIIGGASLWVVNKDAAHERAAWELVKFLASKTSQVTWHTSTGYFPISKAALTDPTDQTWVQSKPQFQTAITQLSNTKLDYATQGCSVGVMPDVRKDVENAMQAAVLQNQDAKTALTNAENTADKQIADYNSKLGG